ncbi:dihydrofolate reductase [Patescibacteria group bacterium]|nr:dihydrofolate reductase [Patescibacteria group bacterium]
MKNFTIIAAFDRDRGVGIKGDLPWHISADLKHFSRTTRGGTVIMGNRTWDSIPEKHRPFPERLNIVLCREPGWGLGLPTEVFITDNIETALVHALQNNPEGDAFVIGGGQVFNSLIVHEKCNRLILTEIDHIFECDTFFPEIPEHFSRIHESDPQEEKGFTFRFVTYEPK